MNKKNKHFFAYYFRCYKKPGDVLSDVKQLFINAQPFESHPQTQDHPRDQPLQNNSLNIRPIDSSLKNNDKVIHDQPVSTSQGTDHFDRNSQVSDKHLSIRGDGSAEFVISPLENHSLLLSSKQSLSSSLQGEVRELLKNIHFAQTNTSSLQHKGQLSSPNNAKSFTTNSSQTNVNTSHAALSQEGKVITLQSGTVSPNLNLENHLPLSQVSVNSLNTALNVEAGINSAAGPFALQSVLASLQNYFPSERLNSAYQNASLGNIYPSALGQSEAVHFIQWSTQLGLPPQVLGILLPFIVQFQEAASQAQPVLQGLFVLFSLLSGFSQMSLSNLTWPFLKGMVILENNVKLNSVQSPLLDELGALLSTSKRRLRKQSKKRISNHDKVSRKDSYLAETDTQENEEDVEAMIDLWPKKESNNSSTAFYYM